MIVSGDDNLTKSRESIVVDNSIFVEVFNMQSKIPDPCVDYVCSKFLCMDNLGRTHAVPDPVKLASRLGRKDIPSTPGMLEEVFTGMKDATRNLFNNEIMEDLEFKVCMKYKCEFSNFRSAVCGLKHCFASFKNFSELFDDNGEISTNPLNPVTDKQFKGVHKKWSPKSIKATEGAELEAHRLRLDNIRSWI